MKHPVLLDQSTICTFIENTSRYFFEKMSTLNRILLSMVHSPDDVKAIAKANSVCQCRISNLENSKKLFI
jgi:hypothetical protein